MTKNISLTGGSGFIGRFLTELFLHRDGDYSVKSLDINSPQFELNAKHLEGDVRDSDMTDQLCEEAHCVVHLAAAHKDNGITRDEYFDVNDHGTKVLLESMSKHNVNRLVFYSSVAVYDSQEKPPITEATPPDPQNPYGASKLAAEKRIEEWVNGNPQRSALVIRPTVVIGPRNIANMYALIDQIKRGRYKFNFGSGENVKSLAIVMNLAEFTVWAIENNVPAPGTFDVYNFIDERQMPVKETIEVVHQELDLPKPKLTVPMPLAMTGGFAFDLLSKVLRKPLPISSARIKKLATTTRFEAEKLRASDFTARFSTEDGLRKMTQWYRNSNAGEKDIEVNWIAESDGN